jgi:Xaa-Pro aminopeptidase
MITLKEYQTRRERLASRLPSDSVAIIPAASDVLRNGDAHYRFRQDSDFYYLTGFNEPDALLIIIGGKGGDSLLFNRARHPMEEKWTGTRLGQDDACKVLGVSAAYPLPSVEKKLPEIFAGKKAVYYAIDRHPLWAKRILKAWQIVKGEVRRGVLAPEAFCDLGPFLGEMRLFKSEAEIALMQQAANISVKAHQRVMQKCHALQYEYQLEAELLYELLHLGCRSVAYDSIVAGGNKACILHYTQNNQPLQPGKLVLIDAGGEFENYAADITRTFPINGQFTLEQRLVYEVVLRAQQAGIACVCPGCAWDEIQRTIVKELTCGLVELGLLQGSPEELIAREAYKPFYMHNSGHWLGLDVHDCGRYKIDGKWRALEPGMVLTVEPGLYISEDIENIDDRWKGIGIRIEDDIQVTTEGHHNLTGDLAVSIDDLEVILRG